MATVVWLNGTFGVGKTTTARALLDRAPALRLFDPEGVGYLLREHLADRIAAEGVTDFQHLPGWRRLVPVVADDLVASTGQDLVAVHSVHVEDHWRELVTGLRRLGHRVVHVVLDSASADAPDWLVGAADLVLDTTDLTPADAAARVLDALPAEPERSARPVPRIRPATWEDRAAVAALRRAWTEENAGAPVADAGFETRFEEWLEREQHQRVTWLALEADRAVGMLNLLVFTRMPRPGAATGRWGYVANVYVLPELRDAGVGRALLGAVTAYADGAGFARLVLSPSERSVPFYRRAGFEPATSLLLRPGPE